MAKCRHAEGHIRDRYVVTVVGLYVFPLQQYVRFFFSVFFVLQDVCSRTLQDVTVHRRRRWFSYFILFFVVAVLAPLVAPWTITSLHVQRIFPVVCSRVLLHDTIIP